MSRDHERRTGKAAISTMKGYRRLGLLQLRLEALTNLSGYGRRLEPTLKEC